MKVDAIIFDKDGTLIDFDAFWVGVSVSALEDILSGLERRDIPIEEILEAYGVYDGVTDIDGVLCKGTYAEMAEIFSQILACHGCSLSAEAAEALIVDAYNRSTDKGKILPTCPDLASALEALKKRGARLAIVTTDNPEITEECLRALGIYDLFDKIYTDDGKTPKKPDPTAALNFMELVGASPERTLMVGDTMTDVTFARRAGISVCALASSTKAREALLPHADAVISKISELVELTEGGEEC